MTIDASTLALFLDSLKDPFLFVDTEHVIRYMNKKAAEHYEKWGGVAILGNSIFDCHNEDSCRMMLEVFEALKSGEEERMISENEKRRIFMRSVRDASGELLGYYERYERPIIIPAG